MNINVQKTTLPNDVYDIVIDAGHGGSDVGAIYNGYYESKIALEYALSLKRSLEKLGLKIKLTRDGSESNTEITAYSMYDENGRVNVACRSKAKYLISFHLNSNSEAVSSGGIEIYAPSKAKLDFAKLMADNIVQNAKTTYSKVNTY